MTSQKTDSNGSTSPTTEHVANKQHGFFSMVLSGLEGYGAALCGHLAPDSASVAVKPVQPAGIPAESCAEAATIAERQLTCRVDGCTRMPAVSQLHGLVLGL